MDEKQFNELKEKFGIEAAALIDKKMKDAQADAETLMAKAREGLISQDTLKTQLDAALEDVKKHLSKLEEIAKEQGTTINSIKEASGPDTKKKLEEVLAEKAADIKKLHANGVGVIEIDLKTAGVTSIGNTILPMNPQAPNSPYLPGPGGGPLDIFGIIYNPNFISNFVSMGRTSASLMPWANETSVEGAATAVQEGAAKPLWNTRFQVEFSKAKKIAAMTTITEEFDQDLPGFTSAVERLLKEEVARKFDDAIYTGVLAVAPGYTITELNGIIDAANKWDAIGAGLAQISKNNFIANMIALNPITYWELLMQKDEGTFRPYTMPPFLDKINAKVVESNKVTVNKVLVGDIKQYKVDMYKDLVLKIGWNNDDFQRNQFSVVAELRYHDYISNNRKTALAYYDLGTVMAQIDSRS